MAYLGNAPAEKYISFERQVFTIVNSQTAYTLSHSVTNENDIRLVVNNIVQEPGSGKAYTASGTTLTLSAALTNGTDEMYCVFLGRAVGTVNAPAGSVTATQLVYPLTTFSSTGIDDNADATAVTIDSSENVGIKNTTMASFSNLPATDLVVGAGSTNSGITIYSGTSSGSNIGFADAVSGDGRNQGIIQYHHNGDYMRFFTNASERVRILSTGGITFNGDTAAANALDDYEEGTFTPTWTSNVTVSVASGNYGYYTKIGNMVTVHFGAVLNATSPSYYSISNAPFQSNIATGNAIGSGREYGQTGTVQSVYMGDNSTSIGVKKYDNTGISNSYLSASITYRTD